MKTKIEKRDKRKASIRKRVEGSTERPRLTVFRSLNQIYAQVIDDTTQKTVASVSTLDKDVKAALGDTKKKEQAKKVGEAIAKKCIAAGITQVVFDRNGYLYHGRVSALAEGAREGGLKF